MKRQLFYKRVFILYVAFILSYTLIIVGLLLYKNNEIKGYQIKTSSAKFLEQTRDKIDARFKTGFKLIDLYMSDRDVEKYAKSDVIDHYSILKIRDKLSNSLSLFSDEEYSLSITKIVDNIVITPINTMSVEDYLHSQKLNKDEILSVLKFFEVNNKSNSYYIMTSDDIGSEDSNIIFVRRQVFSNNAVVFYFLSFNNKSLFPKLNDFDNEYFLILKEGKIIAANASFNLSALEKTMESILLNEQENSGFIQKEVLRGKFIVNIFNSQTLMNWHFAYLIPKDLMFLQMRKNIITSLIICAVLIIIGFGLAFLATQHVYAPISNVITMFKKYADYKDEDEIMFIKNTASHIVRMNYDLIEYVNSNHLLMKYKFLSDLVYGFLSDDSIEKGIQQFNLKNLEDELIIVVMEMADEPMIGQNFSKNLIENVHAQILAKIEEYYNKNKYSEVFQLNYKQYVVIMKNANIEDIKRMFKDLISGIEMKLDVSLVAAVGKPVKSIYEVYVSFNDAINLLQYKNAMDKRTVITFEDLKNLKDTSYYYPLDTERNIIDYLVNGQVEKAKLILNNILERNLKSIQLSKEGLTEFKFAIVATLKRILQQLNKTTEEVFGEGSILYLELNSCSDNAQLMQKINDIFNTLALRISKEDSEFGHSIVNSILHYMHQNYNRDISLTDVADEFNISLRYVGKLLKDNLNISFKDYLSQYRIKKAKEILSKNPDITVNELAGIVGCNNVNTFIRMFKKYEGITPGEYIKNRK